MIEIRVHGTGGQGVVIAAKLLADAAARSGHKSQCFSAYGAERRGGSVESYVRISDRDIVVHSKLYEPDYIVLLEEDLVRNPQMISGLKEKGGILINSSKFPERFSSLRNYKVVTIDANAIARRQGLMLPSGLLIINTVVLGALVAMIPMVDFEYLADAMREAEIPLVEKNVAAAGEAYRRAELQLRGTVSSEVTESAEVSVTRFPVFKKKMPPCEAGATHCVAGEDIRTILSLVQRNQFEEAFEHIRSENPFPGICGRVCFHPCETHCNRNEYDEGIAINALERAVFDHADRKALRKPIKKEKKGKRVAIIGSGPAGMTCAYFLAIFGHDVTVFEASSVLGGIPRIGIPSYRLPREVVDQEMEGVIDLGVTVKSQTEVGKDISFSSITEEYDACFVGVGAHVSGQLSVPGERGSGVISGMEFLKSVALDREVHLGNKVGVIGGGNTAVDAARTAWRLGAREVSILYRRTLKEMPAYVQEVMAAEKEGIKLRQLVMPIKILRNGKTLAGVECLKTELVRMDGEERLRPEPIQGTNFQMEIDTLIVAVGEVPNLSFLPPTIEKAGALIKVDHLGRTSMPGVYAGGDATSIVRTVVDAIGSGKRAAVGIDIWLSGKDENILGALQKGERGAISILKYLNKNDVVQESTLASYKDLNVAYFNKASRAQATEIPIEARASNFHEIISGLSKESAMEEAQRCFQCGQCTLCENCYIFCPDVAIRFERDGSSLAVTQEFCKECGICIQECPHSAIGWEVRTR